MVRHCSTRRGASCGSSPSSWPCRTAARRQGVRSSSRRRRHADSPGFSIPAASGIRVDHRYDEVFQIIEGKAARSARRAWHGQKSGRARPGPRSSSLRAGEVMPRPDSFDKRRRGDDVPASNRWMVSSQITLGGMVRLSRRAAVAVGRSPWSASPAGVSDHDESRCRVADADDGGARQSGGLARLRSDAASEMKRRVAVVYDRVAERVKKRVGACRGGATRASRHLRPGFPANWRATPRSQARK